MSSRSRKLIMQNTSVTIRYDAGILYFTEFFLWLQFTMASESTTMNPICLVENQENQLRVNPKALEILDKISQPVVVVAITGPHRTGKSYLMNRLAGPNPGECCSGSFAWKR